MHQVFLATVILNPTKKQRDEDGAVPVIVVQATTIIATNETQATVKASRLIPEEHADKADRLEVLVIPFRQAR